MFKQLFTTRLKSHALVLTVSVSFVMFAVVSGLFLLYKYDSTFVSSYFSSHKVRFNQASGIEIILANPASFKEETLVEISDKNAVGLQVKKWGVYDIGTVKAYSYRDTLKVSILLGYRKKDKVALELYQTDSKLKLAGNTFINGEAVVPYGIIERANISGKPFSRKKVTTGRVVFSPKKRTKKELDFSFQSGSQAPVKFNDSGELLVSFLEPSKVISANEMRKFKSISGHVIIESNSAVYIRRSMKLNNVIVKAPYVEIESGFVGSVQVLARDSILVERGAKLEFPSALILKGAGQEKTHIVIEENAQVQGVVFLLNDKQDLRKQYVKFNKGSVMMGQIIVHGLLSLEAEVYGEIFAYKLISNTKSSVYYNTLIDAKIDALKYKEYSVFPSGDKAEILSYLD